MTRLLSSLRAALPLPELLRVDEENVRLDAALVQSDSQQLISVGAAADPVAQEAAVALYWGPFTAGFDLPDAPEHEVWQTQTARQMEAHTLSLLKRLLAHYTAGCVQNGLMVIAGSAAGHVPGLQRQWYTGRGDSKP